jgi:hypothetical protein
MFNGVGIIHFLSAGYCVGRSVFCGFISGSAFVIAGSEEQYCKKNQDQLFHNFFCLNE